MPRVKWLRPRRGRHDARFSSMMTPQHLATTTSDRASCLQGSMTMTERQAVITERPWSPDLHPSHADPPVTRRMDTHR
jgi:hypothetical protein